MTRFVRTVLVRSTQLTTTFLMVGCTAQPPESTTEDPIAYLLADAMMQVAAAPEAPRDDGIYRLITDADAPAPAEDPQDRPSRVSIDWTGPLLGLMELAGQYFDHEVVSEPAPPATPVLVGLTSDGIGLRRLVALADAAAGHAATVHLDHDARRIGITYPGAPE